jgi:hypothetical protein
MFYFFSSFFQKDELKAFSYYYRILLLLLLPSSCPSYKTGFLFNPILGLQSHSPECLFHKTPGATSGSGSSPSTNHDGMEYNERVTGVFPRRAKQWIIPGGAVKGRESKNHLTHAHSYQLTKNRPNNYCVGAEYIHLLEDYIGGFR